jgi:hypothetical protein
MADINMVVSNRVANLNMVDQNMAWQIETWQTQMPNEEKKMVDGNVYISVMACNLH